MKTGPHSLQVMLTQTFRLVSSNWLPFYPSKENRYQNCWNLEKILQSFLGKKIILFQLIQFFQKQDANGNQTLRMKPFSHFNTEVSAIFWVSCYIKTRLWVFRLLGTSNLAYIKHLIFKIFDLLMFKSSLNLLKYMK